MNKVAFWGSSLLLLGFSGYLVSDMLAPFIIAFVFAYILQPAIEKNAQRFKISRNFITTAIFILFIGGFVIAVLIILPIIYNQIAAFIIKIPVYKNNFEAGLTDALARINSINPEIAAKISNSMQTFVNSIFSILASAANNIWGYTRATINFFATVALVPIILYYFLRDWPKMLRSVDSLLPVQNKNRIREIFAGINRLLSAYIRGQLNICIILSIYYIIGLNIIGVDLAFLLGLTSGFLIIIPFLGSLTSLFLMLVSCYFSHGASIEMLYVLILFAVGYLTESCILTPKIIGDRIGLHPLWIIFAVFAAGSVFGLAGIALAIPIAGVIKLLLFHLIDYYKSSRLYNNQR